MGLTTTLVLHHGRGPSESQQLPYVWQVGRLCRHTSPEGSSVLLGFLIEGETVCEDNTPGHGGCGRHFMWMDDDCPRSELSTARRSNRTYSYILSGAGFHSMYFLVPKKKGEWRLILDLRCLSCFICKPKFLYGHPSSHHSFVRKRHVVYSTRYALCLLPRGYPSYRQMFPEGLSTLRRSINVSCYAGNKTEVYVPCIE